MGAVPGERIIRADIALTAVFAATAIYAATVFDRTAQWIGAATAMALFAIGVFAFLWSYWAAVQRSRTHDIAVSQLYLLLGPTISRSAKLALNGTLAAQVAVAAATTLARPDGPNGSPGSSLAVGFLVPMLGFGLNGLWACGHANFAVRADERREVEVRVSDDSIGQNADHG